MAPNAKAGSHEPKPGMSKATQRTARPIAAQGHETHKGIRYRRQHEQVKPAIDDADGTPRSRKRELVKDSDDGMNPKRVKSSTTTVADLPKHCNVPRYKQPYTLEDHMVDRKQSTKRKSTGDYDGGSKPKKARATKETSAKPSPASRTSSHRPSQLATKKTSEPTSLDPPKGLIRTYTAEARKNAKNDPALNIMLDRADQRAKKHRARDLPKASQEPSKTSSFVPAPKSRKRASPPSKPSTAMPEATKKILESLPAAMPLPEKLAYMIQQEGPDGYFAKQSKEIAEAFGSKVLGGVQQKPRSSSSKLPPTAAFAPPSAVVRVRGLTRQGQGRERPGSIPAASSVEASVTATAQQQAASKTGVRKENGNNDSIIRHGHNSEHQHKAVGFDTRCNLRSAPQTSYNWLHQQRYEICETGFQNEIHGIPSVIHDHNDMEHQHPSKEVSGIKAAQRAARCNFRPTRIDAYAHSRCKSAIGLSTIDRTYLDSNRRHLDSN